MFAYKELHLLCTEIKVVPNILARYNCKKDIKLVELFD